MIGKITYIISTAGFRAMNGVISDERHRLDNAIAPAAYVSYDPRMMSVVGWHGYRIAFKGGTRNMILYALELLRKNYAVSERYDNYEDGKYVVGVLLRERAMAYALKTGTPEPEPDPTWLYFTMPNGGVVTLTKKGAPTNVTLEYSLDNGNTWTEWVENENVRSLTLLTGQTMHIRNTSETSTGFSTWDTSYYNFSFSDDTYAAGDLRSLLCKTPANATNRNRVFCFYGLFMNAKNLISAKIKLLFTDLPRSFYRSMFEGCINLIEVPETITATTASGAQPCYYMFYNCTNITKLPKLTLLQIPEYGYGNIATYCSNLNYVYTEMTDISARGCISRWLYQVSETGDLYCPAELTIPTGADGLPAGWTRHDI